MYVLLQFKGPFVAETYVHNLILTSLCQRLAELNVAEAKLCLDHSTHVPQTVIDIKYEKQPFSIVFCGRQLKQMEFAAVYRMMLTVDTLKIYHLLKLRQPRLAYMKKMNLEKIKHIVDSCFLSVDMHTFVSRKGSERFCSKSLQFDKLSTELNMKNSYASYTLAVATKRAKSLEKVANQLPFISSASVLDIEPIG